MDSGSTKAPWASMTVECALVPGADGLPVYESPPTVESKWGNPMLCEFAQPGSDKYATWQASVALRRALNLPDAEMHNNVVQALLGEPGKRYVAIVAYHHDSGQYDGWVGPLGNSVRVPAGNLGSVIDFITAAVVMDA